MRQIELVTRGEENRLLLQALLALRPDDPNIHIHVQLTWSGVDSYARSVRMVGSEDVALFVSAETIDPNAAEEHRQFLVESVNSIYSTGKSKIIVIAPMIEALWFRDRELLESLVGQTVSDTDFVRGEYEPKKVLTRLLYPHTLLETYEKVLPQLDLSAMRGAPEIKELTEFVRGIRPQTKARTSRKVPQAVG